MNGASKNSHLQTGLLAYLNALKIPHCEHLSARKSCILNKEMMAFVWNARLLLHADSSNHQN